MEPGSWLRVRYNSARSDERQSVEGKVTDVTFRRDGTGKVQIVRPDGQKMTIHNDGRVVSHGSYYPVTGYANQYDVKTPTLAEN